MTFGATAYATAGYGSPAAAAATAGAGPTIAVEVAFTSNPGVEAPVFVDVTSDFVEGSITRGRQRELDRYQAGTCTVVLRNEDRDYDPSFTGSPYNGFVKPMKRMRIRATYAGVTYTVFDGFVDSWDQQYGDAANNFAVAVVTATDGFKVLSVAELPLSVYAIEVLADNPVLWWRLNEPQTASLALNSGTLAAAAKGTYVTPGGLNDEALVVNHPGGSMRLGAAGVDFSGGVRLTRPALSLRDYGSWAVELWFRALSATGGLDKIWGTWVNDGTVQESARCFSFGSHPQPGVFVFDLVNSTPAVRGVQHTEVVTAGRLYHVVCKQGPSGTLTIYVNGVASTAVSTGTGVTGNTLVNTLYDAASDFDVGDANAAALAAAGLFSNVAVYVAAAGVDPLPAARVAAHYAAGTAPWSGDTPGARMTRVLDAVRWPVAARELDTGSSVLQSANLAQSALEHAQKVNDSEFGNLYMTADGKVRLEGRKAAVNQTSFGTFGDNATTELGYVSLEFDFSDQLIRNDVSVSRNEGVLQNVQDATSQTAFLRHSFTRDGLFHNSDTLSLSAAEFYVSEYKDPLLRITDMTLEPRGAPATHFPQVLGRELTDRVTVVRRPQGVGSAITRTVVIEGIKHDLGPKRWKTSWSLSPAFGDAVGSFWRVGVAGFSELGTTNRLFF